MTQLMVLPRVDCAVEVFTNEDWHDALAFLDLDGNPLSLGGIAFALEMRANVEDVTALIDINNDPNADRSAGWLMTSGNTFEIFVPVDKTSRIPRGDYVFDVVGNADGMQRVLITGTLTMVEGVTR